MATKSSSWRNLSPRCAYSQAKESPTVKSCSRASFCANAGSAMRRPTKPLATCTKKLQLVRIRIQMPVCFMAMRGL